MFFLMLCVFLMKPQPPRSTRTDTLFPSPTLCRSAADLATLAGILGIALLGGLILNLMPCVLPVLSLKLLSVVQQGGRARSAVRASFLASAAGDRKSTRLNSRH